MDIARAKSAVSACSRKEKPLDPRADFPIQWQKVAKSGTTSRI
jgi:hypothetical protein